MALPNLAAVTDVEARGVFLDDDDVTTVMLRVASSVVRAAARGPISEATSTVDIWAQDADQYLDLPGKPVTAITAVVLDGATLTANVDYRLVNDRLWRRCGWATTYCPQLATVTMTHGLPNVPDWVVQLVCDLAIAGVRAAPSGARDLRVVAETVGDYSVKFTEQGEVVATAMELPTATKQALRKAFGGGVGMLTSR